eukprot:5043103-Lingulodinium_polyedra.AAC.1
MGEAEPAARGPLSISMSGHSACAGAWPGGAALAAPVEGGQPAPVVPLGLPAPSAPVLLCAAGGAGGVGATPAPRPSAATSSDDRPRT